jgi:hypothetical protein
LDFCFVKISLLDELSENLIENQDKISDLFELFLLLCKSEKNKYVSIRYGIGQILLKTISNNSSKSIISLLAILLQIVRIHLFHQSRQCFIQVFFSGRAKTISGGGGAAKLISEGAKRPVSPWIKH